MKLSLKLILYLESASVDVSKIENSKKELIEESETIAQIIDNSNQVNSIVKVRRVTRNNTNNIYIHISY